MDAICQGVTEEHEIGVWAVCLLSGTIPKTSSGKIHGSLQRKTAGW